jgi:hypothetical protein
MPRPAAWLILAALAAVTPPRAAAQTTIAVANDGAVFRIG